MPLAQRGTMDGMQRTVRAAFRRRPCACRAALRPLPCIPMQRSRQLCAGKSTLRPFLPTNSLPVPLLHLAGVIGSAGGLRLGGEGSLDAMESCAGGLRARRSLDSCDISSCGTCAGCACVSAGTQRQGRKRAPAAQRSSGQSRWRARTHWCGMTGRTRGMRSAFVQICRISFHARVKHICLHTSRCGSPCRL